MIPRIKQVFIQNYKSIEKAWVSLEPFTILVGANGTGKSNFIDALSFVNDCVDFSIEKAFSKRDGISGVLCRVTQEAKPILGFRFIIDLGNGSNADYAFNVEKTKWSYGVRKERCVVSSQEGKVSSFAVENGKFSSTIANFETYVSPERLTLNSVQGTKEFNSIIEFLRHMRFYSLLPNELREWQVPDSGTFLKRDGSNAASILRKIFEEDGPNSRRYSSIRTFLRHISEGINNIEFVGDNSNKDFQNGNSKETLVFQKNIGETHNISFKASDMSDGTLRAVGVLLAAYQPGQHSLVAVEEPEVAIHPAATGILFDAFQEAKNERQILVSTHSADILDEKELKNGQIRVVSMDRGRTYISHVTDATRKTLKDRLYMAGELLRMDQLTADIEKTKDNLKDFDLFGEPFPEAQSV